MQPSPAVLPPIEMDHPPLSSSSFLSSSAAAESTHRHPTSNQSRLLPIATPLLPIRYRLAPHSRDATPGLLFRQCEIRPKFNRSEPNDYVEDPVFTVATQSGSSSGQPTSGRLTSGQPTSGRLTSASSDRELTAKTPEVDLPPAKEEKAQRTFASDGPCRDSIFCPRCKRCRCAKCTQPRHLPAVRCFRTQECFPEEIVDCCSCLWCAGAIYRRCSHEEEEEERDLDGRSSAEVCAAADASTASAEMCACRGTGCCRRWTILTTLVPCLPCLCLYWPLRWLLCACAACYNCRSRGCRCDRTRTRTPTLEALLIATEPPSSNSTSSG